MRSFKRFVFLGLPISAVFAAVCTGSALACSCAVDWSANLTGAGDDSPVVRAKGVQPLGVQTKASGKASVVFDFDQKAVTISVKASDIAGVRSIELRSSRALGDFNGPNILTMYTASDGPFKGEVNKTVQGADFTKVMTPIVNVQSVLVIRTDAHPDGEIAGFISMHKILPMVPPATPVT